MSYKIGVIGDKESIMPFKILGFKVFFTHDGSEARRLIKQLEDENYGVIYITEELAVQISEAIARYDDKVVPAIILIPNHDGSEGIGMARIQENVKKAIGQNIL